jgi:hypothetical protein
MKTGRKEGKKEGRKEARKEERRKGRHQWRMKASHRLGIKERKMKDGQEMKDGSKGKKEDSIAPRGQDDTQTRVGRVGV